MKLFSEKLKPFYKWLDSIRDSSLTGTARSYCLFDAADIDWRYFRDELFNRKSANKTYVNTYEAKELSERKPYVTLQKDIDATFSLHRSFVARHKTRLQHYRDDLANKGKRIKISVSTTEVLVDKLREKIGGIE